MKKIVIIAGDKSGDLYGGLLSEKLKEISPDIEIFSFGGDNLACHSHQVINLLESSVCGIFEVISSLKKLLNIFKKTIAEIKKIKPELVILIDFPDFNLRIAKKLNKKFPLFYYVSPQIWAWRKGRIKQIKQYVDEMIVLFEFEKEFYKKEGIEARYFGHPLLELVEKKDIPAKKIISFLPGSRKNEIKKHLPLMRNAKTLLAKQLPDYSFQIIRPKNIEESFYHQFASDMPVVNQSYEIYQESGFIITSSGTATIELAILEVPFLIIYKVNTLTWWILKRFVKIDFAGMVNILSKRKIVTELLQETATPENIANTTLNYLQNKDKYQELKGDLGKVKTILGTPNASEKTAIFINAYLNGL